ncbi:MAG: ATP-binding protein [Pseudomonadales bacterium]
MVKKSSKSSSTESLQDLISRLYEFLECLRTDPSTGVILQRVEEIIGQCEGGAGIGVASLLSIEEILPACCSVLSFFKENGLELDANVSSLLSACGVVMVSDVESALDTTLFETYSVERDTVLAALAVYVAESTGFELNYCDDVAVVNGGGVEAELAYVESIVAAETAGDVKGDAAPDTVVDAATKKQKQQQGGEKSASVTNIEETTRVKSYLLDQLMSHSEELVQLRNTLTDIADQQEDQRLHEMATKLASVSENILNDLLKTRMRPIGTLLNKYQRIVRDLSNDFGKKIHLEIIGENIELDSNVIDAITEPLTHLVRNSVDHGIEMPDVRAEAGKSSEGILTLHAFNESGKVVIRISDDGKGVDTKKVLDKAVASGLVSESDAPTLSEKDILNLIFNAGLSTSENVTAVSGRGVGMDAVRRKVEEIKGVIELSSEFGVGTDILLRFPLTMATIKVAVFKIDDVTYAIPSADIGQILRFSKKDESCSVRFDSGQALLHRDRKIIPLIEPADYLNNLSYRSLIQETYLSDTAINVIVFKIDGKQWGLCVDEVMAFMDIVIKPMDSDMNPAQIFSGIAMLGSGDLALIMNLKGLVKCSADAVQLFA